MRLALLAVAVLLSAFPASAQTLYGTLVGNVTDETGLAVPGATVKITHAETTQSRESTTNSTGGYNFPNIPTGTYQVDVMLTGFQSASSRGIVVTQNTSVRVDVRLTVGRAAGDGAGVGHCGGAPDRKRGGADADDERADRQPADGRPFVSELHRIDARRGGAVHDSGGRHQQSGALDGRVGERPAAEQHAVPGRRRGGDQSVVSGHPVLQPGSRSGRNGERRHQQLRRRSGDGRRRRRQRAGEERHQHDQRLAVRVPHGLRR